MSHDLDLSLICRDIAQRSCSSVTILFFMIWLTIMGLKWNKNKFLVDVFTVRYAVRTKTAHEYPSLWYKRMTVLQAKQTLVVSTFYLPDQNFQFHILGLYLLLNFGDGMENIHIKQPWSVLDKNLEVSNVFTVVWSSLWLRSNEKYVNLNKLI